MNNADYQDINHANNRIPAEDNRIPAEDNRIPAEENRIPAANIVIANINLAQINVRDILYTNNSSYENGHFIPVFQDAILAVARNRSVKPGTRRVLEYILGTVDENNYFYEEVTDIACNLGCSEDTVERAIKQLISMQVICKKEGTRSRSVFELSDKMLNPRLAFKGNTRKLRKDAMPALLEPEAAAPLIPPLFNNPDF